MQYDETNFRFLTRMAAEYGEWCYYNGKELVLGEQTGSTITFKADGKQLFDMSIALHPSKFTATHYDYLQHQTYEAGSDKQKVNGLGKYIDFALASSDKLFAQPSALPTNRPFKEQKELDDWAKAYQHQEASRVVVFRGKGEKPDLSVGTIIEVTGSMLEEKQLKDTSLGKYRVTEVIHEVDTGGNYQCRFSAIPESAGYPRPNPLVAHPVGVAEFARVIDNDDPEKIERVRVEFMWKDSHRESDWMRVGMAFAAKGIGTVFIPEKDAQVLVCYEANCPEMPYVNGSFWHKDGGDYNNDKTAAPPESFAVGDPCAADSTSQVPDLLVDAFQFDAAFFGWLVDANDQTASACWDLLGLVREFRSSASTPGLPGSEIAAEDA